MTVCMVLYVIGNRRGTFSGGHKRRITASSNYRHTWSYVRARPLSVICMIIQQAKNNVYRLLLEKAVNIWFFHLMVLLSACHQLNPLVYLMCVCVDRS